MAFEPVSLARERARANIELNGVVERIGLLPHAVSESAGPVRLSVDRGPTNSLVDNGYDGTVEEVEAVSLDGLDASMPLGRVSLVKVDVEGHEVPVLKGAAGILERHRPALIVEVNDIAALRRFAESEGYEPVRFEHATGALEPRP